MSSSSASPENTNSWLIPCSPSIYDTGAALQEAGFVIWHQECSISPGSTADT